MDNKITIKNNWDSITLDEFEQLTQIAAADIPEHYKTTHLISILTGWDIDKIEELPIKGYMTLTAALSFLNTTPPERKHQDMYEVNGTKYIVQAQVDQICTAQFLDYTNYSAEPQQSMKKLASCFLVPEGHKYGDGYDLQKVWFDIGCMNFMDVKALAFFLQLQYAAYTLIMTDSIDRQMKKMKVPKKERIKTITHLRNMAHSLLSSNS